MIRKNIKLKKLFYNILVITSFIVTCLVFLQKIPNSSFIKYENYNIDEVISQNEKYDTKSLNNITTVLNDLLEGYTGEGYNLEEEYYSNVVSRSMDSKKQCDDHCSSHGPGHENGGINLLDTGCRNYMGWSYGNYGSLSIPIWINMTSMNTITNVTHRNTLINDIRYQISLWNSVQMHDGSGTLVYLYEVGIGESTRPNNINGKKVVEILRKDGNYSGQFDPNDLQIRINYSYSSYNDRDGRNVDTPLHEMGHLLGLMDLEADGSGIARGTHKTLMGYNRGTTINGIDKAIKYQDIQGVAVLNNIHTEHKFDRFVLKNGRYLNICFYCDRIDSTIFAKSGVLEMQSETTCVHDFQPLVSCADNHWFKCTKCYKVIESDYYFNVEGTSTSRTIKILGPVNNSIQIANIPNKIIDINVTSIGADAFKNCKNLQKVVIPNTITNIDSSAFENCSYLQSVTLPTNLVAIGSSVFKECGSLATITIPNGVTHIDSSAFENCSYLQSVTLPTNLVAIGSSAFKGCGSLGNITIPNSVTNIDSSAFENCSYLQTIILSSNLNAIGVSAFKGCGSLGSITIPSSVQYIDDSAFENCVSLVSVIVEREISNITNLGNYAFAGCSSALQIIVPQNRVAEYKNKVYWSSYKSKIIPNSNSFDEYELDCYRVFNIELTLNPKYNKLYKLNVNCAKNYKIVSTANSAIEMKIYDSNMDLVTSGNDLISYYLGKGVYYLDLRFVDDENSGVITTTFQLTWPVSKYDISMGNTNLLTHLHETPNGNFINKLYLQSVNGEGFYKFTITGYDKNNNLIILPSNAIKVYKSGTTDEIINCYSMIDSSVFAENSENVNSLIVYLYDYLGFYIDICLPTNEYNSLTLNIQKVTENIVDLFELSESQDQNVLNFSGISLGDNLQKMVLKQAGRFELDTNGFSQGQFVVLKVRAIVDDTMVFAEPILYDLSLNNQYEFDMLEGTYYVGYIGADLNVNLSCVLTRKVTIYGDSYLDPDPNFVGVNGSEVTLNGGLQYSNEITQGFTRVIYLTTGESRLDYYWYSSDENVARITDFGTVVGLNVNNDTSVKIMAVNIEDPSKVFVKEFIIKKDTKTFDSDPIERYGEIIIDTDVSNEAQIDLSELNVPINWLQYFTWSSSDSDLYVDQFGRIFADEEKIGNTYTITGTYKLNSRVKVYITVTVK